MIEISIMTDVPRPPVPGEPPSGDVIDYYHRALAAWLAYAEPQMTNQITNHYLLTKARAKLAEWLGALERVGYARRGMLPWSFIAEMSCNWNLTEAIGRDAFGEPVAVLAPDIMSGGMWVDGPGLAARLAAYWGGAR